MADKAKEQTRYLTIRVSPEELERINSDAKSQGLSRSGYIRCLLRPSPALKHAENLVRLVETLRQLQTAQSAYIHTLSRMLDLVEEHRKDQRVAEIESIVKGEIARADELMELLFKAERRAVRTLRSIQRTR